MAYRTEAWPWWTVYHAAYAGGWTAHERQRAHMTSTISPEGRGALDQELSVLRQSLGDITRVLHRMQQELHAGDHTVVADARVLLAEVRQCVRVAIDTETRFEQRNQIQSGAGRCAPLDLDAARSSIRCRLDRLRTCHGAGGVSE